MITQKQRKCMGLKLNVNGVPLVVKYPVKGTALRQSNRVIAVSPSGESAYSASCDYAMKHGFK
jgi:hypothetical protein